MMMPIAVGAHVSRANIPLERNVRNDLLALQLGASVFHRSHFGTVLVLWCCEPETHRDPRVSSLSKARHFSWNPFLFSHSTPMQAEGE